MTYNRIYFYEGEYCVRSIVSEEDQLKVYRLRHDVFCRTLGWVPPSKDRMEKDDYDLFSPSLGVFSEQDDLLGSFRFTPPDHPFMLDKEFKALLEDGYQIHKKSNTAEVTRFTSSAALLYGVSSGHISKLLYKGMYQWSLANNIRYIYHVVEKRFLRALLIAGLPCQPIGAARSFPPAGAESLAALLDWEKFRFQNQVKRPAFLEWMSVIQSSHALMPARWLAHESKNAASPGYSAHGI
ncbi:MAG TPA: acyl-homoserine-lactone synthase [Gammaproteobacteria bacterium]|nr:acyl-homoserine-lactone synthase [Gammaproteobacteria bacterium]